MCISIQFSHYKKHLVVSLLFAVGNINSFNFNGLLEIAPIFVPKHARKDNNTRVFCSLFIFLTSFALAFFFKTCFYKFRDDWSLCRLSTFCPFFPFFGLPLPLSLLSFTHDCQLWSWWPTWLFFIGFLPTIFSECSVEKRTDICILPISIVAFKGSFGVDMQRFWCLAFRRCKRVERFTREGKKINS